MNRIADISARSEADRAYYRRIAGEYFRRHEQPIQRFSTRVEDRWLRRLVAPGSRVLLVGGGGGRELGPLLARRCEITVLDYSNEMLEVGRAHWDDASIRWVLGDAHDLAEHRERFDAVLSLAAINYFVDAPRAVAEMARALVPGGRLIVSSINAAHRTERAAGTPTARPGSVTRNLHHAADLEAMVREAGLRIESIRGVRFACDCLPAAWNRPGATSLQRLALQGVLILEPTLCRLLPARRGKFLWLIACR